MSTTDQKTVEAIRNLVDYLEGAERKHFDECNKRERRNHIYNSVLLVREWLNQMPAGDGGDDVKAAA